MTADPPVVETDLTVLVVARDGMPHRRALPLPAVLRWDPQDPWAVALDFPGTGRAWAFGWELLLDATGLTGRAGDGDVRFRRATAHLHELHLASPDGTCTLRVDALDLDAFVQRVARRQPTAAVRATATLNVGLRELLDGTR